MKYLKDFRQDVCFVRLVEEDHFGFNLCHEDSLYPKKFEKEELKEAPKLKSLLTHLKYSFFGQN